MQVAGCSGCLLTCREKLKLDYSWATPHSACHHVPAQSIGNLPPVSLHNTGPADEDKSASPRGEGEFTLNTATSRKSVSEYVTESISSQPQRKCQEICEHSPRFHPILHLLSDRCDWPSLSELQLNLHDSRYQIDYIYEKVSRYVMFRRYSHLKIFIVTGQLDFYKLTGRWQYEEMC